VVAQGNRVFVRSNLDRVPAERQVSMDLEVTVPRAASIEGGRYGDFDVADMAGGVLIVSDNACVRLSKIGGGVKVDVKRSDVVRVVNAGGTVEVTGRSNGLELEARSAATWSSRTWPRRSISNRAIRTCAWTGCPAASPSTWRRRLA
jgi:hypothetical protein